MRADPSCVKGDGIGTVGHDIDVLRNNGSTYPISPLWVTRSAAAQSDQRTYAPRTGSNHWRF